MRTTLNIADDVLLVAKELAKKSNKTIGQVISELARTGLDSIPADSAEFMGFRPLPKRGTVITSTLINQLREGTRRLISTARDTLAAAVFGL